MPSRKPWPDFKPSDSPMDQLVKLSHYYGSDIDFIIAGGGNTSAKIGERLFVKGSGTSLATIDADGFVEMDRRALNALLAADFGTDPGTREARFKDAILAARLRPEKSQRPSVECVLHSMLPPRFVVHTHSTVANWLTCARDGQEIAAGLFGQEILWIPYVDPGFILAQSIHHALGSYAAQTARDCPRALLMQNHGLIVCGETPKEVRATTDWLIEGIRKRVGSGHVERSFGRVERADAERTRRIVMALGPLLRGLLADSETLKFVTFDDSETVTNFVGSERGKTVAEGGPFTPDQIVYCYSFPLWLEPNGQDSAEDIAGSLGDAIGNHVRKTGFPPVVVLVKDVGMFTVGNSWAAADTVRLCYIDAIKVAAGAEQLGGSRTLAPRDRQFIEYWEVEAYRRMVSAGTCSAGRMSGKIAVVTGASQGFGRGIAEALVCEGAHAVLADINPEGATDLAGRLVSSHGAGRAFSATADVTRPSSVSDLCYEVVRRYGGLDLLVSNAGALRAGSVKAQPVSDFDLVTSVNYKGYFVCVQNFAPILALQRRGKPGYWSDIIQINSKSGLVGSNRNSAYAGSKFGGIGLTQSFALELIEDGIKVNAVCPGNYFEGPLWSDPDTGLFVQYLRTGKVPGAKTIEDVRRAYEAKVPMGRGCTTADIMKAIYYLVEQKYETGQALPVTGGQVMLS